MEIVILTSVAVGLISLIILVTVLCRQNAGNQENIVQNDHMVRRLPLVRRATGVRNRHRMEVNRVIHANDTYEQLDERDEKMENQNCVKVGAKKRAKLEAKTEKKQQREALEKELEERKVKDELLQEESNKQRERDKIEELKREEIERTAREEKERQEYNEYLKMKEAFSVEEEGFESNESIFGDKLLHEFLKYIEFNKVVMLNDLVEHFKLKHENVVDRIHDLQTNGSLTGVIDDRGKFIYISLIELEAVAKFVKQRGRVSIIELAESSNRLIDLNSGDAKSHVQVG